MGKDSAVWPQMELMLDVLREERERDLRRAARRGETEAELEQLALEAELRPATLLAAALAVVLVLIGGLVLI
jgi:hypothetical protein